jgi:hypothetical protein
MEGTRALTVDQKIQAQELATCISEAIAADVLRLARLLVSKDTRHTFGRTELQLRDLVPLAVGKALEISLAQKNGYHGSE